MAKKKEVAQYIEFWRCEFCSEEGAEFAAGYESIGTFSIAVCGNPECVENLVDDGAFLSEDGTIKLVPIEDSDLAILCPYCEQVTEEDGYCEDDGCRGTYPEPDEDWYRDR